VRPPRSRPFSPPSGPTQWQFLWLSAESKFLAFSQPNKLTIIPRNHQVEEALAASDLLPKDANSANFCDMLIPGGFMPDKLRSDLKALSLTREFSEQGKLVAFICHGGWIPISAKILAGPRALPQGNGVFCIKGSADRATVSNFGLMRWHKSCRDGLGLGSRCAWYPNDFSTSG
jgi:hypothetical protein